MISATLTVPAEDFDVMENPNVATDLTRVDAHLATTFGKLTNDAA